MLMMLMMLMMLVLILLILIIRMLLIIFYDPASLIQVASVRLTVAFIGRGPLVKGNAVPWLTISSHFHSISTFSLDPWDPWSPEMPRDSHAWLSSPVPT